MIFRGVCGDFTPLDPQPTDDPVATVRVRREAPRTRSRPSVPPTSVLEQGIQRDLLACLASPLKARAVTDFGSDSTALRESEVGLGVPEEAGASFDAGRVLMRRAYDLRAAHGRVHRSVSASASPAAPGAMGSHR